MKHLRVLTAAILASVAMGAQLGHAGQSGSFEYVEVFSHDFKSLDLGDGRVIKTGFGKGVSYVTSGSAEPFVEGFTTTTEVVVYSKSKSNSGGIDLEAYEVQTDPDSGDSFVRKAERKSATFEKGAARQEFDGGTGKFSGLSGGCAYKITYLPENRAMITGQCDWQLP